MNDSLSLETIASLIDLTLLNSHTTTDDISNLTIKGEQHHVAALCVFPQHLDLIPISSSITRATVINFPSGNEPHHLVLQAVQQIATHHRIDEIDYVFPYQTYLNGDSAYALSCSAEVYQRCKQHGLTFKVILETGALPSSEVIYQLSRDVINSGCDFLKTSTGKIATGATIPAATAMLSAIVDSKKSCGIKLSGGIRTIEQATDYIQLAEAILGMTVNKHWFRIGASTIFI